MKNKEYTKKLLIDSALHLFRTHDYQKMTIEDIARNAGLTKTTFFAYFKSKEEVLYHNDLYQLNSFEELMTDHFIIDGQALLDQLRLEMVKMAVSLHKTSNLTQNLIHLGTISANYRAIVSDILLKLKEIIINILNHGQESGMLSFGSSPLIIADDLIKLYLGCLMHWAYFEVNTDLEDSMNLILNNYLKGINTR